MAYAPDAWQIRPLQAKGHPTKHARPARLGDTYPKLMLANMDLLTKLKDLFSSFFSDESEETQPRHIQPTLQSSSASVPSLSDADLQVDDSDGQAIMLIKQALVLLQADSKNDHDLVDSLKKELDLQQRNQQQQIDATIDGALLSFFKDAADPVTQLLTLNDLIESQTRPVKPEDVIVHAKLLIAALQEHGLTIEGRPGQVVQYNPNFHEPLSASENPAAGESVSIRFPGASFKGQVIKKAGVQITENS